MKTRLNVMMFLEYAVKGLWILLASKFLVEPVEEGGLGFTEWQKGIIIVVPLASGAILSPFVGQLCDSRFSTEKCLGVLLFFTGILKIITSQQTDFFWWLILGIGFAVLYSPTVSLTNSLAMRHLGDPKREFPGTRLWGTIGWIVAGWGFSMIWLQHDLRFQWLPPFLKGTEHADIVPRMMDSLTVAGVVAMVYGIYCWFFLPKTPPVNVGKTFVLGEALKLLRKKSFTVLLIISLVMAVVHMFYFLQMASFLSEAGLKKSLLLPALSVGQFSEILVMAFLGKFLTRFGFRSCIFIGALCYVLRYFIFSFTGLPVGVYVGAHALHGFCFAMFFAASFIYVDRVAPIEVRHSAQTFYTLVMFGLGPLISAAVNGWFGTVADKNADGTLSLDGFSQIWGTMAIVGAVTAVAFVLLFRDEIPKEQSATST